MVRHVTRGALLTALVAATGVVTWFARQNHFEWMFNPLPTSDYVTAATKRHSSTDDDMVMAVERERRSGGLSDPADGLSPPRAGHGRDVPIVATY